MFANDRNQLRKVFFDTWKLKQDGAPLDAMQENLVRIIELHPEYHSLLSDADQLDKDFTPEMGETNPFLHMSMHIALHEQISTDRPSGIRESYRSLCDQEGSAHEAEHAMMECLGEALWQAQRSNTMPDETAYLGCLRALIEKK